MRTFVVTAAALLTLTGCSAGGKASATASLAHSPAAASPATPTVKPAARPKARKTAKGAPPKAGACDPGPDLLVWFIAPGAPASAQALGSYDSPACRAAGRSTLASLKQTSPTGAGFCTQAAPASQNPGYEKRYIYGADALTVVPPRLKHVILSVGSC